MRQMRKIVFGEPLFPSRCQTAPGELTLTSRSSTSLDGVASESSGSSSMNYPSTPVSTSAPTHGQLDPSFYEKDVPPIPEVPHHHRSTSRSPSLLQLSNDSSVLQPSSTFAHRDLPKLPIPSSSPSAHYHQQSLQRSRSTPYLQYTDTFKRSSSSQSTYASVDSPIFLSGGSRRRLLPQLPQPTNVINSSLSPRPTIPIRSPNEKRRPRSHTQRSLPGPPDTSTTRSSSEYAQEQYMRRSMEKEANELEDWVRSLTPEQQRRHHRTAASSHNAAFDAPPPAYNAIDFSSPPHASAPTPESPPPPPPPH